jgi:hypothetical protein
VSPKPCIQCGVRPKWSGRHRCLVCYTRTLGVVERIAARDRRAGMVPDALRRKTVPAKLWPTGTRWCAGCQTFADLEDFGKGASQCKACVSAKSHAARVQKVYGIDSTEYERLLALQGGKCAICRRRPVGKRLAVDHDHKTMANRGLLCKSCNKDLLGAAHDSIEMLNAAVAYLDTPPTSGLWRAPEEKAVVETARTSRLIDPDAIGGRPSRAQAQTLAIVPRMTEGELVALGGGMDSRGGFYRLYGRPGERPPF